MFNVMDFGAKADINEISTKAFQKAVDACEKQGGGTVYVPFGEFVIGTVFLCDNVHFVFEAGAKIFGSENLKDLPRGKNPNIRSIRTLLTVISTGVCLLQKTKAA